jgi:hypothetical protein
MPQRAASLSEHPGRLAHDSEADDIRRTAIVGHRLANGYMSVHVPGQPCGICDGGPSIPASWRLAATMSPAPTGQE